MIFEHQFHTDYAKTQWSCDIPGISEGNAAPTTQRNPNVGQQAASVAQVAQKAKGFSTFTLRQRQALLRRYRSYDTSPNGDKGIPLDVCLAMPELMGNKLVAVLIHDFLNANTGRMHQQEFLNFCTFLSPHTSIVEKKTVLFDSFDVYASGCLTHDEIFRLYKVLLGHTISDDHILALTFEVLQLPNLQKHGQIRKDEFVKMVPDSEIEERLTVYFNVPPG